METQKKEMINKIRISADISSNDNPSNYDYGGMVKIKSGDDVVFEFLLLNNSGLIDTSQIRALTLEVLDIGCLNAPEPRSVKLLASKTLLADEIVALESVDDFKTGKCNVSFAFSAQETIWGNGHKWIVLTGYSVDDSKTTFTQGWIETFAKYSAEDQILPDVQSPFIRKDYADALYLNMEANLADVEDVADARRNLSVYSYEEVRDLLAQSESNVIDAIDVKIDAGIAQDVQKNSTDIATHSANISSLAVAKANRGEFWFQGGTLTCANKFQLNVFSCVWTATLNVSDLPTTNNSTWIYTCRHVANSTGFHVGVRQPAENGSPYMWLQFYYYDSTNANHYISRSFITDCYDGKPHTYAVIFNGSLIKFLIDNELKLSATLDYDFVPRDCSYPLTIGAITHKISRIKYFNFDMSDANAPYTIDDYISGKDESPLLNQSNPTQDWHSMPTGFSHDASTGKITMTNTSTVNSYPFALGTLLQGVSYKIKVNGSILNASGTQAMRLYLPTDSYTMTRTNITTGETTTTEYAQNVAYLFVSDGNEWNVEITFVCNANSTNSNTYLRADAVDTSRENYFYFSAEKIGALLSLDDVKSGVQILDKSGNGNHANISGTVYASKENNPARCVDSASFSWAGTMTTQKFANSDVAIPANSKVVAYAKASVGMSASFTCGSNSAVSKELSANTLTEIGSFFNASQGAFKVAPSSATTGKMEVYLTIEKF